MDFMHNQLDDGRSLRLFNVIDDFNREALGTKQRLAMGRLALLLGAVVLGRMTRLVLQRRARCQHSRSSLCLTGSAPRSGNQLLLVDGLWMPSDLSQADATA